MRRVADQCFSALWWLCGVVLLLPMALCFAVADARRQDSEGWRQSLRDSLDSWRRTLEDRPRLTRRA